MDKITSNQISVVRIVDGQEVWNYDGTIDVVNNKLLSHHQLILFMQAIMYLLCFKIKGLRRSPTKLVGTMNNQVVNTGVITIAGTTIAKAQDIVFVATNTGLKQFI